MVSINRWHSHSLSQNLCHNCTLYNLPTRTTRKERLGECNKETSFEILDTFYEHGGNFIDTANNYQNEDSEQWLGEWMESRDVRDQIVLATKYTSPYRMYKTGEIQANAVGNNAKSLKVSVDASLKKLRTDYIDLVRRAHPPSRTRASQLNPALVVRPLVGLQHLY